MFNDNSQIINSNFDSSIPNNPFEFKFQIVLYDNRTNERISPMKSNNEVGFGFRNVYINENENNNGRNIKKIDGLINFNVPLYKNIKDFQLELLRQKKFNLFDQLNYYKQVVSCINEGYINLFKYDFISFDESQYSLFIYQNYNLLPIILDLDERLKNGTNIFKLIKKDNQENDSNILEYKGKIYEYNINYNIINKVGFGFNN